MAWVACQTKLSYKYRRRTHTVAPALEEAYLRVDVSCGSEACDTCRVGVGASHGHSHSHSHLADADGLGAAAVAAAATAAPIASLSAAAPFYLLPDDAALSEFLEMFELPDISNYIILASSLKRVALHSGRKASRLRALYRDRRRRAVLFDDLHCLDTAAAATGADEALPPVLAAGLYYARHLGGRVPLILVSDRLAGWTAAATATATATATAATADSYEDGFGEAGGGGGGGGPGDLFLAAAGAYGGSVLADHLAEAAALGVTVLSAAEYVSRCWAPGSAVAQLFDSLTAAKLAERDKEGGGGGGAGGGAGGSEAVYAPHLSQQEVEEGLAAGSLMRGTLHVSRRSPTEAVVELGHGPDAALGRLARVSGRAALNRAIEGDVVAVRLLLPGGPAPEQPPPHPGAPTDVDEQGAGAGAGGAAAAAAAADADYGAELLADAEGGGGDGEEGALAMMEAAAGSSSLPAAEVVALLERAPRDLVACLSQRDEAVLRARLEAAQQQPGEAGAAAAAQRRSEVLVCLPLDRRLPAVVVVTRQSAQLLGCRFVVRIDSWERNSRFPRGHVVRVLGRLNDLKAESEAVLVQCGIHYKPFCEAALAELPRVASAADWAVSAAERALRRDLTGPEYWVVSIDPVGCTDVDDAMHVRFIPPGDPATAHLRRPPRRRRARRNGADAGGELAQADADAEQVEGEDEGEELVEVGVHIADVSWFVRAGGFLDGEARDRCTSVYLVDRRLDMLPGLLSEQLCSLREGVERFAVSVIWTLSRTPRRAAGPAPDRCARRHDYAVLDTWFGRTLIRSRHQLHYQQAQDVLDGRPPAPGDELPRDHVEVLRPALRVLDELTGQLHARRVADGALELASAELRFRTDSDTGAPCAVICKQKVPMMDVVAEMMIAANSAVAERIATAYPGAALLRNHPPPRAQAFEALKPLLEGAAGSGAAGGAEAPPPLDPSSNQSLAAALERACSAAAASDPAAAVLIKSLATRAMSEAQYNSSGTAPPATPQSYHYGLALQYYTHFTSPIRRYADVVVHRQLLAALAGAPPPQPHADLAAAAHNMNMRHRQAKSAQKECSELYLLLLLHSKPHVERALVCGISATRLELFIPAYQLRGAVPLTDRRGLPRLPLRPGEALEAAEEQDDAFAAAERRNLRLQVEADKEAAIVDAATGAELWRVRLWQPVSVRLSAAGHRAHGPKLAMRLLDGTHPDALPPALLAPTPAPATAAPPTAGGGGGGGGQAPIVVRPTVLMGGATGPAAGGAPAAAAAGTGAADRSDAALPPHLRMLLARRQQQGPQPPVQQGPQPAAPAAATAAPGRAGAAAGASGATEAAAGGARGDGDAGLQGGAVGPDDAEEVDGVGRKEVLAAPGGRMCVAAVLPPCIATVGTAAMTAAVTSAGRAGGAGSAGVKGSEDEEEVGDEVARRRLLQRLARLEVRLAACRRGSNAERRLRERLEQLRGGELAAQLAA
ncbi:hypothetical protein HYH02_004158 [Chlamydomonas schloesseri]|uniref:DIS3-like exonuclease 1 n=1 Tax=Chlamydomonas schloesseri TaxID=2026947 RepID=A0A835WS11_9CHLO|nr:hypothetical protein HYH02_004158 [Chlamydomonas schloesseri]|eukprot:KAG2451560.1 hypothetical protein HYH02_004158 [Chlamydomonas schloesseri]